MIRVFLLALLLPGPDQPADAHLDALARYGVGRVKARAGLPVQALRQFEAAAKADPSSPEPLRPLVKLYAEVGRDLAAIRAAEKVLELDPHDADTAHALGKLLHDAKQYPEAAKRLRQAADSPRVAEKPAQRYGLLRDLGRACAAAADWAGAETALRAADQLLADRRDVLLKTVFESPAELDREAAAVREKIGEALAGQKKPTEAVTAYRQAHDLAAKAGDTTSAARLDWNLSGVLADAGKPDEALTHLTRFLKLGPPGPAAYERLAVLLRQAGRTDAIPGTLARLAEENPKNESIRWVLASELTRDDPPAAARLFGELSEKAADPEFFRRLVRFQKETGRLKDLLDTTDQLLRAARPWREGERRPPNPLPADPTAVDRARAMVAAVKAEPGLTEALTRQATADARQGGGRSPDTWELVAALAERDGELASAEVLLKAASRDGGPEVELAYLRVLARQRKWDAVKSEAAVMIGRAPRARGRKGQQGRTLGYEVYQATACAELGQAAAALDLIQRGVVDTVQGDGKPWARRQKAVILNLLGRHADAVRECQDVLAEFPDREVSETRYVLSNSYLGLKEYARAEAELRAVLDDDPDDALALNNLGYNLADQGRNLPEAEAMVRRAIEIDRFERAKLGTPEAESGTYLDSLGWVLFRRGKLPEAREALERAAKLQDTAGDAVVWDHLGDVCFRQGDKTAARKAWEKAAELSTDSHVGRQQDRLQEVRRKLKLAQ
ncbi:MAG TPA: tetratricopeptide repeat protein [Fimbriiglobus sp.]|nr:tetratricopeptide repeat protein [Fimbriiglobus sp.]